METEILFRVFKWQGTPSQNQKSLFTSDLHFFPTPRKVYAACLQSNGTGSKKDIYLQFITNLLPVSPSMYSSLAHRPYLSRISIFEGALQFIFRFNSCDVFFSTAPDHSERPSFSTDLIFGTRRKSQSDSPDSPEIRG